MERSGKAGARKSAGRDAASRGGSAIHRRRPGIATTAPLDPPPELVEEIRSLAGRPKRAFFELADLLAKVRAEHPEAFEGVIAEAGVSRRRAYYLLDVSERFAPFMDQADRLRAIGWTKLKALATVINSENAEELLALAETSSVKQLSSAIGGFVPAGPLRCVLLYLSANDYDRFARAILEHGGRRRGRQLIHQEQALMKLISVTAPDDPVLSIDAYPEAH